MERIGKWAFIVGFVLALLAPLMREQTWTIWVLAVIGLVVGLLNVTAEESTKFLVAAIGLMLSATALQTIPMVGESATSMIANLVAFLGAAVLVVAIKAILETAKD